MAYSSGKLTGLWGVLATRPDFAELDLFLGQHILLTLGQHFNQTILS